MLDLKFIPMEDTKMKVKTFKGQYELAEFDHYMDASDGAIVSVLDLLIRTNDVDHVEDELTDIFAVDTDKQSYVFSKYEITDCFLTDDGLVRVICVK